MGLFDSLQNIISGVTDAAQGVAGDALGGLADNQMLQDAQEQITSVTEGADEAVNQVSEVGQTALDDITQKFGL